MINAIIIDDEPKSVQLLKNMLRICCPNVSVVAHTSIPEEAYRLVNNHHPDLLFLDIDMPGTNGLDLAASFPDHMFAIIYVTAYDHYAMKAIRTNAVDYLLKPVNEKELVIAVIKAEKRIEENRILNTQANFKNLPAVSTITKIALPLSDGLTLVDIDKIIRCQSDGSYTVFHLSDGNTIMVSYNIGEYEKQLSQFRFFRIHHSHLINMKQVVKYKKGRGGTIIMSDGAELDVSARKKDEFLERLSGG